MNEDIKKIEISEDELENVAGGAAIGSCPVCGGRMMFSFNQETNMMDKLVCTECGREKK